MGWLGRIASYAVGGVPGVLGYEAANDKRSEGEYAGVDKKNFALQGAGDRTNRLLDTAHGAANRAAPQASDSAFRTDQAGLIQRLRNQADGKDSMSALQLRQAADQNVAQAQGFAASARPGQAAMAARNASQQASTVNQGVAGQTAMAGIAERNAALNSMGQVVQGARGQDLQQNQFNAEQMLRSRGLNDQQVQAMYQQELQNAALQQQGNMGYEAQRTSRAVGQMAQPSTGEELAGMAMGGLQVLGPALMSDRRNKTAIEDGDEAARQFMERLKAKTYQYRDPSMPGATPGKHTGVMAQDLERSDAGRGAVVDTPNGKMVDTGQLGGILAASVANLNDRLDALESKRRK